MKPVDVAEEDAGQSLWRESGPDIGCTSSDHLSCIDRGSVFRKTRHKHIGEARLPS